ncbi:MAG: ABC transporter permease [Deltaproteobacteria bacterium]|nr:ABC transporter permease [Deltaproteobacteria bacterium]
MTLLLKWIPFLNVPLELLGALGRWCRFVWAAVTWSFQPPYRWRSWFCQMQFIGVQSLPIIMLTGLFTGMVFALQTGKTFAIFKMQNLVGSTVALALAREIAPVFTALMVTARAGSAMAAEIGTMKVTEQIDALRTMAVDPLQYLVTPRVIACIFMVPLLTIVFNYIGCLGAYVVGTTLLDIPSGPFLRHLYWYLDPDDIFGGLIKAAVFGFFLATVSCYKGFRTEGGAEGVGRATTSAVVASSVTILVVDYFLTTWILEFFTSHRH